MPSSVAHCGLRHPALLRAYNLHAPSQRRIAAPEGLMTPLTREWHCLLTGSSNSSRRRRRSSDRRRQHEAPRVCASCRLVATCQRRRSRPCRLCEPTTAPREFRCRILAGGTTATAPTRARATCATASPRPARPRRGHVGTPRALATRYPGSIPMLLKQKPGGARYGGYERLLRRAAASACAARVEADRAPTAVLKSLGSGLADAPAADVAGAACLPSRGRHARHAALAECRRSACRAGCQRPRFAARGASRRGRLCSGSCKARARLKPLARHSADSRRWRSRRSSVVVQISHATSHESTRASGCAT